MSTKVNLLFHYNTLYNLKYERFINLVTSRPKFMLVSNFTYDSGSRFIWSKARSDCRDLYTFRHKICGVKISHYYNFNPFSITLWYENNKIIFSLSIVIGSDKWGTMSVTIVIFSDSVLGNIANDTASVSSLKYIIFGWL